MLKNFSTPVGPLQQKFRPAQLFFALDKVKSMAALPCLTDNICPVNYIISDHTTCPGEGQCPVKGMSGKGAGPAKGMTSEGHTQKLDVR